VATGGTTGQVLTKTSATDYATNWTTPSTSPTGAAGGVLSGTYPNPGMAAGAAATNVGTLGGVLTGTLPNPGVATGAITSTHIADRTIQAIDIVAATITGNELASATVALGNLAANSVDSSKIVDASVAAGDLAAGAALGNLNQGDIAKVLGSVQITTDVWNNVALGAGDNGITGASVSLSLPDANDLVFVNISAAMSMVNPSAATHAGWRVFLDGGVRFKGPTVYCATSTTTDVGLACSMLIGGPSTIGGAISSGSHVFELRFYSNVAISSGGYLLCASSPDIYKYRLEVWVLRR
jgi:hypothetical protein